MSEHERGRSVAQTAIAVLGLEHPITRRALNPLRKPYYRGVHRKKWWQR